MKALLCALKQEKALVGAFAVILKFSHNLREPPFAAIMSPPSDTPAVTRGVTNRLETRDALYFKLGIHYITVQYNIVQYSAPAVTRGVNTRQPLDTRDALHFKLGPRCGEEADRVYRVLAEYNQDCTDSVYISYKMTG